MRSVARKRVCVGEASAIVWRGSGHDHCREVWAATGLAGAAAKVLLKRLAVVERAQMEGATPEVHGCARGVAVLRALRKDNFVWVTGDALHVVEEQPPRFAPAFGELPC